MEANQERIRCVDCSVLAPTTTTNYTLIGGKHGWRLSRVPRNGEIVLEWRCPRCWTKHKARASSPGSGNASTPPSSMSNLRVTSDGAPLRSSITPTPEDAPGPGDHGRPSAPPRPSGPTRVSAPSSGRVPSATASSTGRK